ncbi:hypothetical protein F4679DRAFT_320777 [Xylaria curta]|nr:hypothetical protein F4679DRAFT_320777 [Xylaria curta]
MPSLMPLRRSARDFVNEVRATSGAREEGRDSGSGESIAQSESGEAPWQGSTKRAFLRSLITTSKAKLGSHLQDNRSSDKSDHDAEQRAGGTVSKHRGQTHTNKLDYLALVCYFPPHHTLQFFNPLPPNPKSSDAVQRFHGSMVPRFQLMCWRRGYIANWSPGRRLGLFRSSRLDSCQRHLFLVSVRICTVACLS